MQEPRTHRLRHPSPSQNPRYKVDILVIVGHPDDDIEVAAYLAKVIEQQSATADGKSLGTVTLRVKVEGNYLPQ